MPLPFLGPDHLLAHFARTGDPRSLGRLFDRTAPELLRVAAWLAGNRVDAEDLLQRTFLTVLLSRRNYDPSRRALPWLIGILGKHGKKLQDERRSPSPGGVREPAPAPDPARAAAATEFDAAVQRVRSELEHPYAEVLDLHLGHDMAAKDIALRLGRPAGTVRTQIVRGLQLLRERLPMGFVSTLAFVTTVEAASLATVRAAVVAAAKAEVAVAAAAVGSTVLFGGMMMTKKVIWLGASLLLLLGGGAAWWAQAPEQPASPPVVPSLEPATSAMTAASDPAAAAATTLPDEPAQVREVASQLPAADPDTATVVVHLRWSDDQQPAAAVGVSVHSQDGYRVHERDTLTDHTGTGVLRRIRPGKVSVSSLFSRVQFLTLTAGEVRVLELVAERQGFVAGIVVDHAGQGVADARLWLSDTSSPFHGFEIGSSDASGRFRLPFVPGQHLGARKRGHAPSQLLRLRAGSSPIELRLPEFGGTVRGRVVDSDNVAVADAIVEVGLFGGWVVPGSTVENHYVHPTAPKFTTDEHGEFVCEGIVPGSTEVRAWAAGHGMATQRVLVTAHGTVEAMLTLPRGAIVTGTVRDDAGAPIEGAVVTRAGQHWDLGRPRTRTDAEGRYHLEDLTPGSLSLTASSERFVNDNATLMLDATVAAVWDPVLRSRSSLAGRVVGPDGAPVPKVSVGVVTQDGFTTDPVADTGDDGAFTLRNVGSDAVTLRVFAGDCQLAEQTDVRIGPDPVVIELDAEQLPTAFVTGRVRDLAGAPLAAQILIWKRTWRSCPGTRAGADGTFAAGPLPAGDYAVTAEAPGYGRMQLDPVHLAPGQRLRLPDIVMAAAGRAELEVRGLGGTTRLGMVHIVRDDGVSAAFAQLDGSEARVDLPPGTYYALAQSGDQQRASVVFAVASDQTTRAVLVLTPGWAVPCDVRIGETTPSDIIRIVVRDDGGGIAAACELHMIHRNGSEPVSWSPRLSPGSYAIEARCSDGRTARASVSVADGGVQGTLVLEFAGR